MAQVAPVQSKFNTVHQIKFKWTGLQLVNQWLEFELLYWYSFPLVKFLQSKNRELDTVTSPLLKKLDSHMFRSSSYTGR